MICPYCQSDSLRKSKFRAGDFFQMLLLRLPVRCRNCQERSYVSISMSRQLQRESIIRHAQDKPREGSQTSPEGPTKTPLNSP